MKSRDAFFSSFLDWANEKRSRVIIFLWFADQAVSLN